VRRLTAAQSSNYHGDAAELQLNNTVDFELLDIQLGWWVLMIPSYHESWPSWTRGLRRLRHSTRRSAPVRWCGSDCWRYCDEA
jgi:hypothetical protein